MNLLNVKKAETKNVDAIVAVDGGVIGNDSRRDFIKKAVAEERCLVATSENEIAGFLIYDTNFFECSFISLIIVSPSERRKGHATALMNYFVKISPTQKIFSSTNQSNQAMQKVFSANGFVKSGVVENLDEGDPEIIYFKSK